MKLGASAFNWSRTFELSQLDLLSRVRGWGLQAFEIPIFDPRAITPSPMRRALEADGLECTVCAILPQGINPISPDRAERKKAHTHLAACIQTAAELGATLMGGPVYAPIGYLPGRRRTAEEWQWAVECFQQLSPLLDANSVSLALEPVNRSETFFVTTAAETAELCRHVGHPRVGVLVDTFHANIEEKNIPAAIAALGPALKHIHLSENDRGTPGSGHLDFAAILRALQTAKYDGLLMIEGLGYISPEQSGSDFTWRRPDETADAIVAEGAAYLRSLLHNAT